MLKLIIGNPRKTTMAEDLDDFDLTEEEKQFFQSATETAELLRDLNERGVSREAAIGGALTQLLTQLFVGTPSHSEALGVLASCLSQASENSEAIEGMSEFMGISKEVH